MASVEVKGSTPPKKNREQEEVRNTKTQRKKACKLRLQEK